jgi:integrase
VLSSECLSKSYRLLRAILNTAVDEDKILARNPCRVKGADKEEPAERPAVTVAQVFSVADRMPSRFRVMVLLAAFASLRWGEITALRRRDLAVGASKVDVTRAFVETRKGLVVGPPKSRAGVRGLIVPEAIRHDLLAHLETYVKGGPDALLFTGENGGALRRPNFNQRVKWTTVVTDLGLQGLHFHDLRHAGNTWAARAGTSTRDLMARMGHDDMRAALIYQHATSEADQAIADRLSGLVTGHRNADGKASPGGPEEGDDGTAGALVPAS